MPFTIVETLEDGKKVLTCVPEGWVKHNYLAWPRNRTNKLTKEENSLPGPDWFLMQCKVKRSGLTYREGQLAISIMTEIIDRKETDTSANIKPNGNVSQETNITTTPKNDITEKLDNLIDTVNAIENNQQELQETQQELFLRIVSMQTELEDFLRKPQNECLVTDGFKIFNPITSLEALQELEDSLEDDTRATELIKHFSVVGGMRKGHSINNCYTLSDMIFDRRFLTNCSWAGGSRSEDRSKICFKSFRRVINMFFSVIALSDANFTMAECQDFFKTILRNSIKRCQSKMLRASTTKKRPKKNQRAPVQLKSNQDSVAEPGPSENNAAEECQS